MIIGIGTDICDIRRIEKLLGGDKSARFIERTFSETEQETADARDNGGLRAAAYAKRFAAKEAAAKALGSAVRGGILFTDISVVNDEAGAPSLIFQNKALERLNAVTPQGKTSKAHISLSDDHPYAQAFVVIEAV